MSAWNGTVNGTVRVAIFTSSMDGGGAERVMAKLAGGIADQGYDVDLVLSRAEGHYLSEVPGTVRIVDLDASRVLASIPGLIRYLRRARPAALLTSMNYVNIVGIWATALARVETRLVVSEHNALSLETAHSRRRRHRLLPGLIGRFYPWADRIVCVARGTADDLARTTGLSRGRMEVVHNPIVTPEMKEMAKTPMDHPWFRPGEPPVVLSVGRLSQQKDFGTLLRAFARVRDRRTARLVILGEGPERGMLESLVSQLGLEEAAALPGWVGNPYPWMAHAGAYVLSSRWEGLPSVLIEALYCGVPIVATDCLSGPREILEGGEHGLLVPVGDVEALAQGIESALNGDVPPPAAASWRPYELESVVKRYLDVLVGV